METATKKPVHQIKIGSIEAAIWENESSKGTFASVTFSRSYKSDGTWKAAHSYPVNQLGDLKRAITEAETYMKDHYK